MLSLTNNDRTNYDRSSLSFADRLAAYAKSHSEAMANKGYIYHSTSDELRKALEGYKWELGGENVGVGASLESLEDAFMASDAHRKNILNCAFKNIGVGVADGYWTQDFATPR